jgi:hypothetical protein
MAEGRRAGIARHREPNGPMAAVNAVSVTAIEGVHGAYRGGLASTKAGRNAPDWRGGFLGRVIEAGKIAVGDEIRIL